MADPQLLAGVTVPMVTPMTAGGIPDARAAAALLDTFEAADADVLMLLGSNGEGALVPQREAAAFAVDVAADWRRRRGADARVLVTAFGTGTRATVAVAEALLAAEPSAVVAAPPLYFHHTETELVNHYRAVAAVGAPVVVYNIPRYSGNPITPALLARLVELPGLVGIKDSGGTDALIPAALALREQRPGFQVSQGAEGALVWALRQGADGITPGLANLAPALCVALFRAAQAGDADAAEADAAQRALDRLAGVHAIRPGVAAMKAALHLRGLVAEEVAPPFERYDDAELARLGEWLASVDDILTGEQTGAGAQGVRS